MNKIKLIACTISILLNIVAIGYVTYKIIARYDNKNSTATNWIHLSRKSLFENLPAQKEQYSTIFLGASIIQYCEWSELLEQSHIVNRGIAGDTSQDILMRLEEVINRKPNQLFIMVGVNDIMVGEAPLSIAKNMTKILEQCLSESPATSVHLLSILPVAKQIKNASQLNEIIETTNKLYQIIAKQRRHINFIDLTKALQGEEGFLNKFNTIDGIHLTGQGYQIIQKTLRQYIKAPEPIDRPKDTQ